MKYPYQGWPIDGLKIAAAVARQRANECESYEEWLLTKDWLRALTEESFRRTIKRIQAEVS